MAHKNTAPITKTITGGNGCSLDITSDWWHKERTYRCTRNNTFDFSDAARRVDTVTKSMEANNAGKENFPYTDSRLDARTGIWTKDDHLLNVNASANPPACQFVCKTRRLAPDSQAALTGVSTQYQSNPARYDSLYHVCDENQACPAGENEEIVKPCQCMEEFGEAAGVMAALGAAGKDLSCAGSGQPATSDCVGEIRLFRGKGSECLQNGLDTTFFNCCNTHEGSFLFLKEHCPEESVTTVQARMAGRAHSIGSYCKKEVNAFGGVQEADVYCLFNSKMARIIQEQGRTQLQRFVPVGNWGSAEAPNCEGLTPEEFQMLDFSRIDFSELLGDMKPLAQPQLQNNVQGAIDAFQNSFQK